MESKPNDQSSETAPLIKAVDCDEDLFMVPLKRPSPRVQPSQYRNVKIRTPPRSPAAPSPRSNLEKSPQPASQVGASPYLSPAMSGRTIAKPDSPPMFVSPLMSPESENPGLGGSTDPRSMANIGSLLYDSPPMSGAENTKLGSSPILSSEKGSARQSPPQPSSKEHTSTSRSTNEKTNPSTKPSSINDSPPAIIEEKADGDTTNSQKPTPSPPAIPTLSAARTLKPPPTKNLGLALHLVSDNTDPSHLAPPTPLKSPSGAGNNPEWTLPDSPLDRLSQLRATPDSAYDRARQMEVRRSEWKHVVYRFPVKGKEHWVIDVDLTESSHARLADVARRSSEGFEWNGDYELANIYRVLAVAHGRVMEEMRGERRGVGQGYGEGRQVGSR